MLSLKKYMEFKNENSSNLYSLLNTISAYISDEGELGLVVGYSIIKSLKDFNTRKKNPRIRKLDEMGRIYKGLEEIISLEKKGTNHYKIFNNLEKEVDDYLKKEMNNSEKNKNNYLLKDIIKFISLKERNKERNKEDLIKTEGQELIKKIKEGGEISNFERNSIKDYETISYYFTRKKGDRR